MPTTYKFFQEVDLASNLVTLISSSSIVTPLSCINTLGTGSSMEVDVCFSDVLSSADQTTLNSIMSNYTNATAESASAMIAAITNSIATDENLISLLRAKVISTLPTLTAYQLQLVCNVLGITT